MEHEVVAGGEQKILKFWVMCVEKNSSQQKY